MKKSWFTLEHTRQLTADTYELVLSGDTSAITAPGQFVNLELPGKFLRRPISICNWTEEGALMLLVKVVGEGTRELVRCVPGTELDVLSGLGNGFDLSKSGSHPVLAGGGIGIAPLYGLARRMLDAAGLTECKIVASNSLDEYIIRDLLLQGAKIDSFGVGERLITSKSEPVFGGVYKLAAVEDKAGNIIPKIKISANPAKITTPHFKKVYRLFDNESGKAFADLITLHDETVEEGKPLELFDPDATWKRSVFTNFTAKELLVPVFRAGKRVYNSPPIAEMRAYCAGQIDLLWDEVKRFENPHNYYVDLSQKLWDIQQELLEREGK